VLIHNRDGELEANLHPRTFGEEQRMALAAIDCVLDGSKACYASTQLTTGIRFYDLMRELGLRDPDLLKSELGEHGYEQRLWQPNVEEARAFAQRLREHLGGRWAVVTPAPFVAPGWSQPEYLAFWAAFIRTHACAVYFNKGWQYSRGCTYEYLVAHFSSVPTLDAEGQQLDLNDAIELIADATRSLQAEGLPPLGLSEHLAKLESLREEASTSATETS